MQSLKIKVVIDANDTVYIAHDILDLIREFKETRAVNENNQGEALRDCKMPYLVNHPD
jgi:hypothetical protein